MTRYATLDLALQGFADEATDIERDGTSVGYYTHLGLLSTFLREAREHLAKEAKEDSREQAVERFILEDPRRYITAIKNIRDWLRVNGYSDGLKEAKDLADVVRKRLYDQGKLVRTHLGNGSYEYFLPENNKNN